MATKATVKNKPGTPDWLYENIAEASKNARKIYLLYLGFLAYCALTVVSTSDRQIVLNESARLPIVNLNVSLNDFFIVAPLLAIFIFAYYQFYLIKTQDLINHPKIKEDTERKERLYPWFTNFAQDPEEGWFVSFQRIIFSISIWWLMPAVLVLLSLWYVKKHDPVFSYVVGIMPLEGAKPHGCDIKKSGPSKCRSQESRNELCQS